jgi:HK97 family phage prohead protease
MSQPELLRIPFAAELKFVGASDVGEIGGYGAVFNNLDFNGDMLAPGAFDETLAEQKAAGRVLPMFGEHSFAFVGGDPYPIGGWTEVEPDEKGLRVKGNFIGMQYPEVGRVYDLVKAGLIPAMSIAFRVREGGAIKGKKAGEPNRLLKSVDLYSIDLVSDPANPLARIDSVKSIITLPHQQEAASSVQQAYAMCADCMGGGDAPTKDERNQIMGHLNDAHRLLTGTEVPMTTMSFDQQREFKKWLHRNKDEGGLGLSAATADDIAALLFKHSAPRDEADDAAARHAARKALVAEMTGILSGFSLKPKD